MAAFAALGIAVFTANIPAATMNTGITVVNSVSQSAAQEGDYAFDEPANGGWILLAFFANVLWTVI
jgi:hypothetical protein